MSAATVSVRTPPARAGERPRGLLACVCLCTVLVIGSVASVNLAVPQLAASTLRPSGPQLVWIVDTYVVLFACLVIPAGALGDRLGRAGVLLAGLGLVTLGSLVCALAPGVGVLLTGRALTGVGAACVLPNALAVLVHATPAARRPHALAVWAAMSGVGGMVGNIGGGLLLSLGSWRWLFAAVVPLALVCTVWAASAAPPSPRHKRRLDPLGAVLLTAATGALVLAVVQGPELGWDSAGIVGALVAAGVAATAWVRWELRTPQPLLDPRLFRVPELRAACLGMLVVFFGMFGFFYLNASLLQYGRGFTVLQAGIAVVPMSVPLLLGARLVPALVRRVGVRTCLGAAFAVIAVGLVGLADALHRGYVVYAAWMVIVGVGITLALPTLTAVITAALPPQQAGVAGGLQATTRELGSALGVATVGSVLASTHLHDIARAYTSAAGAALDLVATVVALTGAAVVVEMTLSARRRAGEDR